MTILLGTERDVAKIHNTRFWPERGLIHWEDQITGDYGSMSIRDFLFRVNAVNESLAAPIDGGEDRDAKAWLVETRNAVQSFVEEAIRVVREAREQGEPHDQSMTRAKVRALPTQVAVSQLWLPE